MLPLDESYDAGLYYMIKCMIEFSSNNRKKDAVKIAYIKFANTLSCSVKLSMDLVGFEVSLYIFLVYLGEVRDALAM